MSVYVAVGVVWRGRDGGDGGGRLGGSATVRSGSSFHHSLGGGRSRWRLHNRRLPKLPDSFRHAAATFVKQVGGVFCFVLVFFTTSWAREALAVTLCCTLSGVKGRGEHYRSDGRVEEEKGDKNQCVSGGGSSSQSAAMTARPDGRRVTQLSGHQYHHCPSGQKVKGQPLADLST